MEAIYTYARFLHIIAGMTAFIVAPVALIAGKGGKSHKRWGSIFFWAMVLVAFSAVPMTLYHPNLFLLLVAIFSFHLSLFGYRSVKHRHSNDIQKSKRIDFSIACMAFLCYAGFIAWGISVFLKPDNHSFGYIAIVFGLIGMRFSLGQLNALRKPQKDNRQWWFDHMQGMVGSYIATLSAFSAVNFFFLPDILRWLWPTIIGAPLLYYWERHYKQKFRNINIQAQEITLEQKQVEAGN